MGHSGEHLKEVQRSSPFLVNYGENIKQNQDLCHLGKTMRELYSCIHYSAITNAVNESSISGLLHVHVGQFYYSFLL